MWASLTKTFAKDLGDFANVITRDTQRIVDGNTDDEEGAIAPGADTGGVVAGDESSPEGALFRITREELEWLQSDVATFAAPLTPDEEETAARLSMDGRDPEALLASNETVRDQYAYLVTQRAEAPAATPKTVRLPDFMSPSAVAAEAADDAPAADGAAAVMSPVAGPARADAAASPPETPKRTGESGPPELEALVARDEFFRRYFTRLLIFRRKCSADRRRRGASAVGGGGARDGGDDTAEEEDEAWDTDGSAAAAPSVSRDVSAAECGKCATHSDQRAQQQRRIAELEGLVKALSAQVGHLQDDNAALLARLASAGDQSQPSVSDANAASPQPRAPPAASGSAQRGTSHSQMAIEDDDWATLS